MKWENLPGFRNRYAGRHVACLINAIASVRSLPNEAALNIYGHHYLKDIQALQINVTCYLTVAIAEKFPSDPPQQNPRVLRDQCLIVHGLPETRAATGSLETRHDIDELSKVIKHIVPSGEVIIILTTHRLGPRVANLPNSLRPLKVVLSETAMLDLLMKSRFHLRGSHLSIYFHVDLPLKERQKLAEASTFQWNTARRGVSTESPSFIVVHLVSSGAIAV